MPQRYVTDILRTAGNNPTMGDDFVEYETFWRGLSTEMDGLIKQRYEALDRLDRNESTVSHKSEICIADIPEKEDANRILEESRQLREELDRIYRSRGWRYLCWCYRIKDRLMPRGSLRYRIVRKMFRGLRFIKRSVRNLNKKNYQEIWTSHSRRWSGLCHKKNEGI